MSETTVIKFRKRSWLEWGGWAIWFFGIIFFVQSATTSGQELEPRAAMIFWISLVVWLLAGLVVWFVRRDR